MGLPLLIAAFSVERPAALPRPLLQPTFDATSAAALSDELSSRYPDRSPGSTGSVLAARWIQQKMALYGVDPKTSGGRVEIFVDSFPATIPGKGKVTLRNAGFVVRGRSDDAIVITAHRDDTGMGAGANDNASGTGALVELARAYVSPPGSATQPPQPNQTILFLSTDGGSFGGLGATHFAQHPPFGLHVVAVLNLDSIGAAGQPRLEIAGDQPRSPAPALVETAAARIQEQSGSSPGRTSALGQLVDLGFPFTFYEQAPFVGRGIPAVTLTTSGDRPSPSFGDTPTRLSNKQLTVIGRATQSIISSLDEGLGLARGTGSYVYLGPRVVRGWAIELALVAMLLPFAAAAVDLFARCRRRRIPVAPALRALRSRLGVWLWIGAVFLFLAFAGVWPGGTAAPLNPETSAASKWPALGLILLIALSLPAWFVAHSRLTPRRQTTAEEELAGHTAAMLALLVISLLVVATNTFALLFLLPALHIWLWLPHVRAGRIVARLALLAAGLIGPFILIGSFMFRFGLGLDAPWYLAELVAIHYTSIVTFLLILGCLAALTQLTAIATGRYAPYPTAAERPARGPIRNSIRAVVLTARSRRRGSQSDEHAQEL